MNDAPAPQTMSPISAEPEGAPEQPLAPGKLFGGWLAIGLAWTLQIVLFMAFVKFATPLLQIEEPEPEISRMLGLIARVGLPVAALISSLLVCWGARLLRRGGLAWGRHLKWIQPSLVFALIYHGSLLVVPALLMNLAGYVLPVVLALVGLRRMGRQTGV